MKNISYGIFVTRNTKTDILVNLNNVHFYSNISIDEAQIAMIEEPMQYTSNLNIDSCEYFKAIT